MTTRSEVRVALLVWSSGLLASCWEAPEQGSTCVEERYESTSDEPTAIGSTPRELVQAWEGRSFAVVWTDPSTPLPGAFTLDVDSDALTASSVVWEDRAECQDRPSVEVMGPAILRGGPPDFLYVGNSTFAWNRIGGREQPDGIPDVYVSLDTIDSAVAAWVGDVLAEEDIVISDADVLLTAGLYVSFPTERVRVDTTFETAGGEYVFHTGDEIGALNGAVTVDP
jgi:hypothetical protein